MQLSKMEEFSIYRCLSDQLFNRDVDGLIAKKKETSISQIESLISTSNSSEHSINDLLAKFFVTWERSSPSPSFEQKDSISFFCEENYRSYVQNIRSFIGFLIPHFSSKDFYLENIKNLPNVAAIVSETLDDVTHFTTILRKKDFETREKIYSIEIKMFDIFKGKRFCFSVTCLQDPKSIDSFIKNKDKLFYKLSHAK